MVYLPIRKGLGQRRSIYYNDLEAPVLLIYFHNMCASMRKNYLKDIVELNGHSLMRSFPLSASQIGPSDGARTHEACPGASHLGLGCHDRSRDRQLSFTYGQSMPHAPQHTLISPSQREILVHCDVYV